MRLIIATTALVLMLASAAYACPYGYHNSCYTSWNGKVVCSCVLNGS